MPEILEPTELKPAFLEMEVVPSNWMEYFDRLLIIHVAMMCPWVVRFGFLPTVSLCRLTSRVEGSFLLSFRDWILRRAAEYCVRWDGGRGV